MKRWLLCLLALFMLGTAVAPAPVHAGTYVTFVVGVSELITTAWSYIKLAAEWASNLTVVKDVITVLSAMYDLWTELFKNSQKRLGYDIRAILYGDMVAAKVEEKIAQARVDAGVLNAFKGVAVGQAMKNAVPKHEYLCKKMLTGGMSVSTQDFEKEVSRMAAEAINDRYRCPTCDGRGPDYIGLESARRCTQGYGNTLVDGAKTTCEKTLDNNASLADADISPIDGGQVYEMPAMSRQYYDSGSETEWWWYIFDDSSSFLVPNPSTDRQKLWVAAWDNIFLLAGPRPTPKHGAGMNTPVGKVQRAMFNHCAASQNALVKQCTDLLAYYTRPNCNQIETSETSWLWMKEPNLCKGQQEKCLAAKDMIDIAPFSDCKEGLSPYEEDQIDQLLCKSSQHYVDMVQAGATYEKLEESSDLCESSWIKWRAAVDKKHANCTAAVNGMQSLESCWAAVDSIGGGQAALKEDGMGLVSDTSRAPKAAHREKLHKANWQKPREQRKAIESREDALNYAVAP